MNIQPLSTAADLFSAERTKSGSDSASPASSPSTSVNQNDFLKLLVAQLKNQDPMNPADSTQFMGELAQFSQLQEMIGVHQDFDSLLQANGITPAS